MIPAGNKITILLVDNHPTTITGLRALFSQTKDIKMIRDIPSGYDIYSAMAHAEPTLLLLDIATHGPNPIELIQWIHENHKKTCAYFYVY